MIKDNAQYVVSFESTVHGVKLYVPAQDTEYHISRYVAANAQNIYSSTGATKETLEAIAERMISVANTEGNAKTWRTDIGALAHAIRTRTKYPVDEDCAIRMGALYCFLEDEDPNQVQDVFTQKKISLAKGLNGMKADPDLYAFFLTMGVQSTPAWREYDSHLTDTEYFQKRAEMLHMSE